MKAIEGISLLDLLNSLSRQGKDYGNLLFTRINDKKGEMLLSFSDIPNTYVFVWDKEKQKWTVR